MAEEYIVVNASAGHCRFMTNIVGQTPYFSTRPSMAKVYRCRELAENAAQKCRDYTGRRWRAIDVSAPTEEDGGANG